MDIKMIVSDLDGTLLREDKTISLRTASVLRKCRDMGIKLVYATARGASADQLTSSLEFDGRIRMNGAFAFAGDDQIYKRLLHTDEVREMLLAFDAAGFGIVAENDGLHYSNIDYSKIWPEIKYMPADFNTLDIEIEKLYTIADRPEILPLMNKYLQPKHYIYVARDDMAMLMHIEATKSKALAALAAHLGILPGQIVAFGDDTNDLDMLQYCGCGVVMANGLGQAKAVADEICDTNDNDGIAKWLEKRLSL